MGRKITKWDLRKAYKYAYLNEQLVLAYRCMKDERYLKMLMDQVEGLIKMLAKSYCESIPNVDIEDLISDSYLVLLDAVNNYDECKGKFSTILGSYIVRQLNHLYTYNTRQKRYNGSADVSYDNLIDINRDGGCNIYNSFGVDCKEFTEVEFEDFIKSIGLTDTEMDIINYFMAGYQKNEIAKILNCSKANISYYMRRIKEKMQSGYLTFEGV